MKDKVLFIGSFIKPKNGSYGGVLFASTSLRDKLINEGYKVVELDTTLKDISVTKVSKRFGNIFLRQLKFLYRILTTRKAKTLLVFVSAGNSYIDKLPSIFLAKLLKKNILIFPRSGHIINDYNKSNYKNIINSVFKLSNYVICQSEYWREFFKSKGVDYLKLVVIENWVPNEVITKSSLLEFREFNKLEDSVFRIVYASRIEKNKGVVDIIKVAKLLKGRIAFEIDVFGDGSCKNEFINLIELNDLSNEINYKGWLDKDKMYETLNRYNIALFTSRFEGYPNAVHDFVFSKIPIIAFDIPQVRAIGKNIIKYYTNIDQLHDIIIDVYNNHTLSRELVEDLYRIKTMENSIDSSFSKIKSII